MLPVYICEDNAPVRSAIKKEIEDQIMIQGYDMRVVSCTHSPEDILSKISSQSQRGIYFLDVELKGESMNGFSLGQKIRRLDSRGFLIYVTAFKDLAFQTFRYHLEALDYIVKENPDEMFRGIRNSLQIVTDRILGERNASQQYFSVKTQDSIKHIPLSEICFFETTARTHRILLHGLYEQVDFLGTLQELEAQLDGRFIRVHRAYLVNPSMITEVDLKRSELHMKNGEICLFSRKAKPAVIQAVSSAIQA